MITEFKNFRKKADELEKAKEFISKTKKELTDDSNKIVELIVSILDDINKKELNINIINDDIIYYKIEHRVSDDSILHKGGADTMLKWKNKNGHTKDGNSFWNITNDNSYDYECIIGILEYLIEEYPKNYKNVLIKKDTDKYNV